MSTEKRQFDKSRFKGTNMKQMQAADNAVDKALGKENKKTRGDFHSLEKGLNYFRIYPHHNAVREMCGESDPNDKGESFAESRVVYYLPQYVEDKNDKGELKYDSKKNVIMKEVQKAVFDSRIHGGTKMDVVDEYIKFVNKKAIDEYGPGDSEEKAKYLENIVGNWKKRISGLNAKTSWVMFCDHILKYDAVEDKVDKKFGKLEIGKAVKFGLQKLSAAEAANQPLGTDPFTDPVEGIAIVIDYNPDADKAQDYYNTSLYQPKIGAGRFKLFPLVEVDDQGNIVNSESLDNMLEFDSLFKQYRNVYRKRDFEIALEGLNNFDSKYEYGLINDPEFTAVIEEISEYYPEEEKKDDIQQNAGSDEIVESEKDEYDLMSREELKKWHKDNKTGFVCIQKTTDDELKEAARLFANEPADEGSGIVKEEKAENKTEEQPKKTSDIAAKAKAKLDAMRKEKESKK